MNANTKQPPNSGRAPVNPAAYNMLVAAARLRDIRLLKSEFTLDAESLHYKVDDWKMTYDCEIHHADYDRDSQLLIAFVQAEAFCKKKTKRILSARCRYVAVYDIHGEPEDDTVNAFANRVARFAVYPYFRAHFSETCSQAGLQLPPLPVIKETKLLQRLLSNDQKQVEKPKQREAEVTTP